MAEPFKTELSLMRQGIKIPRRKKLTYPVLSDKGEVRYGSFAEEMTARMTYLRRLREYLPYQVAQGLMSEEEASNLYLNAYDSMTALESKGGQSFFVYDTNDMMSAQLLPFSKQIDVPDTDWRFFIKKESDSFEKDFKSNERDILTQKATSQRVGSQYLPFLNTQVAQGSLSPDQRNQIMGELERQITLGVNPRDLPFASELESYESQFKERLKGITQQNRALIEQDSFDRENTWNQSQFGLMPPNTGSNYAQRTANAQVFEQARDKFMAESSPYADWIDRFMAQRAPNPYAVGRVGTRDFAGNRVFDSPEDEARLRTETEESNLQGQLLPESTAMYPATPSWLTPFTGQGVGTELNPAGQLATPSGQSLSRLLPSQLSGLEAYSRFLESPPRTAKEAEDRLRLGYKAEPFGDILARAQRMLPQNPSGGYSWRPARQV